MGFFSLALCRRTGCTESINQSVQPEEKCVMLLLARDRDSAGTSIALQTQAAFSTLLPLLSEGNWLLSAEKK